MPSSFRESNGCFKPSPGNCSNSTSYFYVYKESPRQMPKVKIRTLEIPIKQSQRTFSPKTKRHLRTFSPKIKGFQLQNRGCQTGDLGWTVAHIWSYGSETSHFRSVQEGLNRRKKTKASRKRTINQPFRLHDRACWPEKISAFSDQSAPESANLTSPRRIAAHTQIHKRKKAVDAYSEMRKTHNWIRTSRSNSWMY